MWLPSDSEDVALEANNTAILEDIGCNADLHIVNQEQSRGQHSNLKFRRLTFDKRSAELSVKVKVSKVYDAYVD